MKGVSQSEGKLCQGLVLITDSYLHVGGVKARFSE